MAVRFTKFVTGDLKERTAINEAVVGVYNDVFKELQGLEFIKAFNKMGKIVLDNTLPITPKDTGALRDTGRYKVVRSKKNGNPILRVTFGDVQGSDTGKDVDYAVYVELNRPRNVDKTYTTPGTGPFYLTRGTEASISEIKELAARQIRLAAVRAARKARQKGD